MLAYESGGDFSESATIPLSVSQEALWVSWQLNPAQRHNIIPLPLRVIAGNLDVGRLRQAVDRIGARHPQLRGRVVETSNGPQLTWADAKPISVTERRISGVLEDVVHEASCLTFDLRSGPLTQVEVLHTDSDTVVLFVAHHLVFDGTSVAPLLADLREAYGGKHLGGPDETKLLAEFARRQSRLADGIDGHSLREFWRQYLAGRKPMPALPGGTERGLRVFMEQPLDKVLIDRVDEQARALQTSRTVVLLAAFFILMRRYLGQDDLLIALPFHGRTNRELRDVVGFFSNALPIRQILAETSTYADVIRSVHKDTRSAVTHGDLPGVTIMSVDEPNTARGDTPVLFQHWKSNLREDVDVRAHVLESGNYACTLELLATEDLAGYPLAVMLRDDVTKLRLIWKDPDGVLGPNLIGQMNHDYLRLLEVIVDDPRLPIGPITGMSHRELATGVGDRTQLPRLASRPPGSARQVGHIQRALSADTPLTEFAHCAGIDVGFVLLATFAALLSWYTGRDELTIGFKNRRSNQQWLHINIPVEQRFDSLLRSIVDAGATGHEGHGRDIAFHYIEDNSPPINTDGVEDLILRVERIEGQFLVRILFDCNTFDEPQMLAMADHFVRLLDNALHDPSTPVGDFQPLSEDERNTQLLAWNLPDTGYPDTTLGALVDEQAGLRPWATAVTQDSNQRNYRELVDRAHSIARGLISRGVQQGELVGLLLPRGIGQVEAILGVLFAGAAYLPIDLSAPPERIDFIVSDARIRWLIIDSVATTGRISQEAEPQTATLDELAANTTTVDLPSVKPTDPAYCIYTSGTTGRPKGVVISHRNVVRLVRNDSFPFAFGPDDVWTFFHSYSFDFSVWEMFCCFAYGGRLIVVQETEAKDSQRFWQLIQRERVTVLNQTPSAFNQLQQAANAKPATLEHLRYVIFGGEKLQPRALARWADQRPEVSLVNMYGITETTVHVTARTITPEDIAAGQNNVGTPIPTTTVNIVDPRTRRRLLPVGAVGEMLVGGLGVAEGYLQRPELTTDRFIPNPFGPGIVFCTGDLARHRPDGTLEVIGRQDHQIKLRGYRIELGEIEWCLRKHPDVAQALAFLENDGDDRIVGYVLPVDAGARLTAKGLREYLAAQLPDYMIPSEFRLVEQIPLTGNGKLDREALKQLAAPITDVGGTVPRTATARTLAKVWSQLLGVEHVAADASFFELGGHSLLAAKLVDLVGQHLGIQLTLHAVFTHPQLQDMANLIDTERNPQQQAELSTSIRDTEVVSSLPASSLQERIWFAERMEPDVGLYNIPLVWRVHGQLDLDLLSRALALVVERNEILRTRFVDEDGRLRQIVGHTWEPELEYIDLTKMTTQHRETELHRGIADLSRRIFDIGSGRLLTAAVFRLDDEEQVVLLCLHHLVHDGESTRILLRELDECYMAARRTRFTITGDFGQDPIRDPGEESGTRATGFLVGPASGFQRRVWLAEQMEPGAAVYNIPLAWRVEGLLDEAALSQAFTTLVDRHELLRTRFIERNGNLQQVVAPPWIPLLERTDLRRFPSARQERELRTLLLQAAEQQFDPSSGKLFTATLVDITNDTQILLLSLHHLIFDGESVPVLLRQLDRYYQAAQKGLQLSTTTTQYCDFIALQDSQRYDTDHPGMKYWIEYLRGAPAFPAFPGISAPAGRRVHGGVVPVELTDDALDRIRLLQTELGLSAFMIAAAALAALLHHRTGSDDVTFGCPIANRTQPSTADVLGPCLNTVVLRSILAPEITVSELLRSLRDSVLGAFAHQDVPFETVVEALSPARRPGWTPYVDVSLYTFSAASANLGGHRLTPHFELDLWAYETKVGLSLTLVLHEQRFTALLSYRGDRFSRADVEDMAKQFGRLLQALPDYLDGPVSDLLADLERDAHNPRPQFQDFVVAQQHLRHSVAGLQGLEYWRKQLNQAPAFLPAVAPHQPVPHGVVPIVVAEDFMLRLRRLQSEVAVSSYMVAATALAALLHRWTGQADITFGCPAANRPQDFAATLGPCVNDVVLRSRATTATRLGELLRTVRNAVLDVFQHQAIPFEDVVAELNPPRHGRITPYIDVSLTYEFTSSTPELVAGTAWTPMPLDHHGAGYIGKASLAVIFTEAKGNVQAVLSYRGDRFTQADGEQLARLYGRILERILDSPDQPLGQVDLVDEIERQRLTQFETGAPAAPVTTVPTLVTEQSRRTPTAVAVESERGSLTYRELDLRSRALAEQLRPYARSSTPVVALLLGRGPDLVIAMLAAWQSGCSFCPIDPDYPKDRRDFIIDDLGACAIVTDRPALCEQLGGRGIPIVEVSDDLLESTFVPHNPDPDSLAYVLYTSGTTGQPKGVLINHRSVGQLVQWHREAFRPIAADRISQIASVGFDAAQWEVWPCLAVGATLVPYPRTMIVPELTEWLTEQRISITFLPTPLAEAVWASQVSLPTVRLMLYGGAALSRPAPSNLPYGVFNHYGPTEATVCAVSEVHGTIKRLNAIGRPIDGAVVYIVDEGGQRCPVGVAGEILIGGTGVARGYWKRPDLTAEKFLACGPDDAPGPVYRTGDRGRWLSDGTLQFLGRIDRQLSIRGYRIEPQEIEANLLTDPAVGGAVVVGDSDRSPALVAYLVAHPSSNADTAAVLGRLQGRLPRFMIPDAVVWLDEIPMSPHGKVDTARLPFPSRDDLMNQASWVAPTGDLEQRIAAVWRQILRKDRVGAHDNFFDLGGNSIQLGMLHARLESVLGQSIPIHSLFEAPTVSAFARQIRSAKVSDGIGNSGGQQFEDIHQRAARGRRTRSSVEKAK